MKSCLVIAALAAVIAVLCIVPECMVQRQTDELRDMLAQVNDSPSAEAFAEKYEDISDVWLMFVSHNDIGELSTMVYQLKASCNDGEEFERCRAVLMDKLSDIPYRVRFSWQNVF